jgi:tetratricopeptide (TPR) repeat protein
LRCGCRWGEYLRLLGERTAEILSHGVPASYCASLAAGLGLAFDRLANEEPAGLALLRVAAVLAPEPIPFTLFTAHPDQLPPVLAPAAGDPLAFAALTRQLRRRALARVEADSLQLHRLVQAILRRHPAIPASRHPGIPPSRHPAIPPSRHPAIPPSRQRHRPDPTTVAWALLRQAVPLDVWNNPATWPTWRQQLPHVLAVTDSIFYLDDVQTIPEVALWLLQRAASYLHTRGEPRAALPLYERVQWINNEQLGSDHPHTLTLANYLANVLHDLGEYQTACALNEDTLARSRRVLGDDHPDTLDLANNLAHVLRHLGENQAARTLHEDTLARRRRVLGDDHPNTLESAQKLAVDLHQAGEHQAGRVLNEDTLVRHRRVLGRDHPRTLGSADSLAHVLRDLGEDQVARALDEDTFARYRRVFGDDHPDTLISASNLANDLTNLGELVRACELREWIERQRES